MKSQIAPTALLVTVILLAAIGLITPQAIAQGDTGSDSEPDKLNPVQQTYQLAIDRGVPLFNGGQPAACAAVYEVAATALLASKPEPLSVDAQVVLRTALRNAGDEPDDSKRAWVLRRGLDQAMNLSGGMPFEPLIEAPLPEGFPGPGPVGEVVVKTYPAHRLAYTGKDTEGRRFMRLFNHIKKNNIAMTTPVQMTMSDPGREAKQEQQPDAPMREQDMAFFYVDPELGEAGEAGGGVEVRDIPEMTVLSIGIRGWTSQEKLTDAREKLLAELNKQDAGYVQDGPIRLMGYNSPMVPAERRFSELQVVVKPRDIE